MKTFGERLKHFAQVRHEGVGKFAEKVGVHPASMSRYISGGNQPTADVLARFAELGGMNVQWLLTGKGQMDAPKEAEAGGRLLYPSEVGPMGEIVGEITLKVGDNEYGLVPLVSKQDRKTKEEEGDGEEEEQRQST